MHADQFVNTSVVYSENTLSVLVKANDQVASKT